MAGVTVDEGHVGVVFPTAEFAEDRPHPIRATLTLLVGTQEIKIAFVIIGHADSFDHSNII